MGKGRRTVLLCSLKAWLRHCASIWNEFGSLMSRISEKGGGSVYLPWAIERKYKAAAREWKWQYVFPARDLSRDPRSGRIQRHHVDEATIQKAIRAAVLRRGLTKRATSH